VTAGSYNVKLTVDGASYSKTIVIETYMPGSIHTAAMAGLRRWKGQGSGMVGEFGGRYAGGTGVKIDTQFAIEVINGGIIRLPVADPAITLNIAIEDTVNKMLTFEDCAHISVIKVYYYYAIDSIVYTDNWTAKVGHGYEYLTIHSP
jgi:hypothetical protein